MQVENIKTILPQNPHFIKQFRFGGSIAIDLLNYCLEQNDLESTNP